MLLEPNTLPDQIERSVNEVKASREMGERYMVLELMLKQERKEGRAEGRAEDIMEILQAKGPVSEKLRDRVFACTDPSHLLEWLRLAVRAENAEEFEELINELIKE